jgi:hypothetical protein
MLEGFSAALRFPLKGEKRWVTLGLTTVCFLIPIVGPIVLLGYGVLAEKALIADPDAAPPEFDFNQFAAHLKRGVAPFVVSLLFVPILMVVIFPVMFGLIFAAAAIKNGAVGLVLILVAVLFELVLIGLSTVILTPMTLKAGLEQTIGGAFNVRFAMDFLKRVGFLTVGYNLLLMAFSILVGPFTLCVFFVGVNVFTAYLMLVQFHVRVQLYRAYLARGGTPLAIVHDQAGGGFPITHSPPPPPLST